MDKSNVMVKFVITGEGFYPNIITDRLNLTPSKHWIKGDEIPRKNIKRKETNWIICTEYEESFDINEQLNKIIHVIAEKKHILQELKKAYDIDYIFVIVVNVENNEKPTMYFNRKFIEFANEIEAEFYIDLYIYS